MKDPALSAKFFKLQPYRAEHVRDAPCVIWVDGCVEVSDPSFVENICGVLSASQSPLLVYDDPERNGSLRAEVDAIMLSDVARRLEPHLRVRFRRRVWRQYNSYLAAGFPDGGFYDGTTGRRTGVYRTTVMAWNLRDPRARSLMDAWWRELEQHATVSRDQLSLPFVVWRANVRPAVPWPVERVAANGQVQLRGEPGWVAHEHQGHGGNAPRPSGAAAGP